MADEVLGEIRLFAGEFAPSGWAKCDGALLPIAGNEALFSILGVSYGGDGSSTFRLPDLRGRVPIGGSGTAPIGAMGGAETVSLTAAQIPSHTHPVQVEASAGLEVSTAKASLSQPIAGARLAAGYFQGAAAEHFLENYAPPSTATNVALGGVGVAPTTTTVGASGGGVPHDNIQPSLAVSYIIAIVGEYPSRSS